MQIRVLFIEPRLACKQTLHLGESREVTRELHAIGRVRGALLAMIGELGRRLNLAGITKFEDERKKEKNSGSSSSDVIVQMAY